MPQDKYILSFTLEQLQLIRSALRLAMEQATDENHRYQLSRQEDRFFVGVNQLKDRS